MNTDFNLQDLKTENSGFEKGDLLVFKMDSYYILHRKNYTDDNTKHLIRIDKTYPPILYLGYKLKIDFPLKQNWVEEYKKDIVATHHFLTNGGVYYFSNFWSTRTYERPNTKFPPQNIGHIFDKCNISTNINSVNLV